MGRSTQMQSALGEAPDRNGLLVAAHGEGPERQSLADGVSRRLTHGVGDDELRAHLFVEALKPRRQIHRVADDRIFLAARRTDSPGHRLTDMDTDAEADRPR